MKDNKKYRIKKEYEEEYKEEIEYLYAFIGLYIHINKKMK